LPTAPTGPTLASSSPRSSPRMLRTVQAPSATARTHPSHACLLKHCGRQVTTPFRFGALPLADNWRCTRDAVSGPQLHASSEPIPAALAPAAHASILGPDRRGGAPPPPELRSPAPGEIDELSSRYNPALLRLNKTLIILAASSANKTAVRHPRKLGYLSNRSCDTRSAIYHHEFHVFMPDCSKSRTSARREMVHTTLSSEPIHHAPVDLPMTQTPALRRT
jgi:hypothetical protein